jgi:hypothetical protein
MTDRYQMCQNAAAKLQQEAFAVQIKGRTKPLKRFIPCAKGVVYTAECTKGNTRPQSLVTHDAALEICSCHRSLSENDLISYELPKVQS